MSDKGGEAFALSATGRREGPPCGVRNKVVQGRVDAAWREWFDRYRRYLRAKERDPYEADTLVRAVEALARRDRFPEAAPKMAPRSENAVAFLRGRRG